MMPSVVGTENNSAYGDHLIHGESPIRMFGKVIDAKRCDNGGSLATTVGDKPLYTQGYNHLAGIIDYTNGTGLAGGFEMKFLMGPTVALCGAPVLHYAENANPVVGTQLILSLELPAAADSQIQFVLPINYPFVHIEEVKLNGTSIGGVTDVCDVWCWATNLAK